MLCVLYVIAVGLCLGVIGLLVERLMPATWPRRWLWCVLIAGNIVLPGYYRSHHTWSVLEAIDRQTVASSADHAMGAVPLTMLDPDWWAHTQSYDRTINRFWLGASALLIILGLTSAWRVSRIVSR